MRGSKNMTVTTSEQMRAARARGVSKTDWARVRREANADPEARAMNRKIGALIAKRTRGPGKKPAKVPTTLRLPATVLARWRASGAGWQTRMAEVLARRAP